MSAFRMFSVALSLTASVACAQPFSGEAIPIAHDGKGTASMTSEIFSLAPLAHAGFIPVRGGPESLIIDAAGGRAFTHLWNGLTVAIGLHSHQITPSYSSAPFRKTR